MTQQVKNPPAVQEMQETCVQSLGQEDPMEEEMATHSSILVWETPRTGERGGLESMGSQRVRHDWVIEWQQQEVEETQMSIKKWIDEENTVCTYNYILFSSKEEVNPMRYYTM